MKIIQVLGISILIAFLTIFSINSYRIGVKKERARIVSLLNAETDNLLGEGKIKLVYSVIHRIKGDKVNKHKEEIEERFENIQKRIDRLELDDLRNYKELKTDLRKLRRHKHKFFTGEVIGG